MTAAASGGHGPGTVVAIALATPGALGLETLARRLLLPAELEALRQELRPTLTPIAWVLLALTVAAVPLALRTQGRLGRRWLARAGGAEASPAKRAEARFEAFFVAGSLPQLPAVCATVALTAGAEALPALLAAGVSAAAVVLLAALGRERRDGARRGRHGRTRERG